MYIHVHVYQKPAVRIPKLKREIYEYVLKYLLHLSPDARYSEKNIRGTSQLLKADDVTCN
jgi:hypothetical protein